MRLGVTLRAPGGPAHAVDMALEAEDAGFRAVYVPERHFDAADGFSNPFAVAAAISGRLRQAWLGVVPAIGMEHPLRVVEQANMLDLLTGGRSLIVLSEVLEPRQYASFGLPVPRNGLFQDLLQHMENAWSWDYQEEGPPLEFSSGAYAAKMAGRIMPMAWPRRALETDTDMGVRDAARRGWAIQLRITDVERARLLLDAYREVLTSVHHHARVVQQCLDGNTLVWADSAETWDGDMLRNLDAIGIAEVRFDLPIEDALAMAR
jgi:alkanesulfonate monooxygenase SsuD/methylene tetrahydromethanopterin reductase-like flavin-dependent oxidoreductase (luciferase family)